MSVLSFPRIYFNGYMAWDVATANNNDYQPIYDAPNAQLDWSYLSTHGITPDNFQTTFRQWVITPQFDTCPPASPGAATMDTCSDCGDPTHDTCHMSSRWGYYGGSGCWFVDYPAGSKTTLTSGGDLAYGQAAAANDAIINQPIIITGNTSGGHPSPARLVDVNPEAPWSSQIFFGSVKVGDDQTFISGSQNLRMHSRLFFVPRCLDSSLIIAGAIGVIFQATFPFEELSIGNGGNSQLLSNLVTAMQQSGAQGLMLRFAAFNTLYYQNGIFNDIPQQPHTCNELETMYKNGEVLQNPAYSHVAGTLGVWNQGELSTMPGGHLLVPSGTPAAPNGSDQATHVRHVAVDKVPGHGTVQLTETLQPNPNAPANATANASASQGPPAVPLGPVLVEVDGTNGIVSLDLCNAIPESSVDGTKYAYGPITVGVQLSNSSFQAIGSFTNYDWDSYLATSGIVDVQFQNGVTWTQVQQWMQDGLLALQIKGQVVSLERPLIAETDERGVYVDECMTTQVTVQVRYKNGAPPAGTMILLAQYYPWTLNVGAGQLVLFGTTPPDGGSSTFCNATPPAQYVNLIGGDIVNVEIPEVGGQSAPYGEAIMTLGYNQPGFPTIVFYPFTPTDPSPTPQSEVIFGYNGYSTYTIGNAHYCTVRAMPADNALLQEFVDRWNGTGAYTGQTPYDRLLTWQFIYSNILYVYDMLFPVMEQFMPLGNLESVEAAVDQLVTMISEDWLDSSTLYMPVTRDLSAAKRLILLTWGDLVNRRYPQEALSPLSLPCDET